jgi:putative transposase
MLAISGPVPEPRVKVTCSNVVTESKVIEGEGHFLTLLRYVEGNAARANLVARARDWEWGSLWDRTTGERDLLHPCPVWLPDGWETIVDVPLQTIDLNAIRRPSKIGRPRHLRRS